MIVKLNNQTTKPQNNETTDFNLSQVSGLLRLYTLQGVSFLSINANQGVFPLSSWKGQYVHVFYQLLPREPSHADVGERLQTDL